MKTTKLFCIAFFITTAIFTQFSCSNDHEPEISDIYVFVDVSDSLSRKEPLPISDIFRKIGIDTLSGSLNGANIKFFTISDISEGDAGKVTLQPGKAGLNGSNPIVRNEEIKEFNKKLTAKWNLLHEQAKWGANRSKIYQNICKELEPLSESKSDKKIVIIFSDMLENGDYISFYGKGQKKIKAWIKDNESMKKADEVLKKAYDCSLQNLDKIEFYIVSERTQKQDEQINLASGFWKRLLILKGADEENVHFDSKLSID